MPECSVRMGKSVQSSTDKPLSKSFVSIGDRLRRVVEADGISLTFRDSVWIATDTTTGERASDVSMAGAWAHLRDVDSYTAHHWLDESGVTVVRPPSFLNEQ